MPAELTSNVRDVALIFEGGGMRASYTSAVVATLLAQGIHFDWVAGISAGSSCLANYLSRDAQRARQSFVEFAADPQFGDLRTFVRGRGFFNAEYIYEQTGGPSQALPFDFATFAANPAARRVGAFEADTGRTVYWAEDQLGTLSDLMRRVRASSTMPVIMPPVRLDDHVYLDGALGRSGGIPLDAAKADGFQRFFVVLTQERAFRKRPTRSAAYLKAHFRHYPAAASAVAARHRHYNRTREELFDLERSGRAMLFVPDRMPVSNRTRDVSALRASHQAGLGQARREAPRWREFLGL